MKEWRYLTDGKQWELLIDGTPAGFITVEAPSLFDAYYRPQGPSRKGHHDQVVGTYTTLIAAQQAVEAKFTPQ